MSTMPPSQLPIRPDAYGRAPTPGAPARPWSPGRVLALVFGAIVALVSTGVLGAGVVALLIDQTQRDADGFIETTSVEFESNGYAISASGLQVDTTVPGWLQLRRVFGDIRLSVAGTDGGPVFVGVAHEEDAAAYLAELGYDEIGRISNGTVTYVPHQGGAPTSLPAAQEFWAAWTEGSGEQTLTVELETGNWVAVAMNADGSAQVKVIANVAADLPALPWLGIMLLVTGGIGLVLSALAIYLAVRESRQPR